ncbi:oxidized purine nucleoside triphosphate hydrolase isoform X3 [Petaurus breviceps papuanus]|uniref:oxidized purine nucleoside triphosphate hydrolase isoform X3 n=1 Tax=Petaurus breviceps papuanus TaxID=3040969 RepID=UPI0036DEB084
MQRPCSGLLPGALRSALPLPARNHSISTHSSGPDWGRGLEKEPALSRQARAEDVFPDRTSFRGASSEAGIQVPRAGCWVWPYALCPGSGSFCLLSPLPDSLIPHLPPHYPLRTKTFLALPFPNINNFSDEASANSFRNEETWLWSWEVERVWGKSRRWRVYRGRSQEKCAPSGSSWSRFPSVTCGQMTTTGFH